MASASRKQGHAAVANLLDAALRSSATSQPATGPALGVAKGRQLAAKALGAPVDCTERPRLERKAETGGSGTVALAASGSHRRADGAGAKVTPSTRAKAAQSASAKPSQPKLGKLVGRGIFSEVFCERARRASADAGGEQQLVALKILKPFSAQGAARSDVPRAKSVGSLPCFLPPKATSAEAHLIRMLLAEDASLRPSTQFALTMPWLSAACFEADAGAAGGGEGCDENKSDGRAAGGPEAGIRVRAPTWPQADRQSGDALALQVEAAKTAEHLKELLQRALVPPSLPPLD